jgi:ribonuclease T1
MVVAVLAAAIVGLVGLAGCGGSSNKSSNTAASDTAAVRPADPARKPSGTATVAESALPAEARDMIRRIDAGGPFQHRQDGVTFQNREGLLPKQAGGYYREYTVDTPGAQDRGARRLILGRQGELYYTPDHYRSFLWVVRGGAS